MELLLTLVVVIVVLGLAYWAVHRIVEAFGLPAPVLTLADVVLVIAGVLYLLKVFGLAGRLG